MKNYSFELPDIIVFPVIDWYYRFQRPQQIAVRLAAHGHRVFYLRTYFSEGMELFFQPTRNYPSVTDVQLGLPVYKDTVADLLDETSAKILFDQFELLKEKLNISKAICLVDLPFWSPLVIELRQTFGWKIIYDSMDQLSGFSNVTPQMLEPEIELIRKSNLVLTTSHLLFNEKSQLNSNCLLVPNGTDFDHFNYLPEDLPNELLNLEKPIIGYYGAISDWLDTELIYNLASAKPHWSFVFIGRIENADVAQIREMSNVYLLGEKPYELLPRYLHQFDTCIIPFKKIPLTEATNPVKLFEFLSAGKSVVATDLDELRYYQEYARLAASLESWLAAIELALDDYLPSQVEKRQSFARQNTWNERILLIEDAIQATGNDQTYDAVPLPFLLPQENLISKKLLAQYDGREYLCLLYEKDNIIYKQTSFDLAEREARFLSQLDGDYFPKFIDVKSEPDYSVIRFQKIEGNTLHDSLTSINSSAEALDAFIRHCLYALVNLHEHGITHRNICRNNILIHDGMPIFLDFGWAVSEQDPYFSPSGLGGYERPQDGVFSDVYSMGKIFEYINRQHYRAFDWVISLMITTNASMRISDLNVLKALFNMARNTTLQDLN